jgi:hypothetical protein
MGLPDASSWASLLVRSVMSTSGLQRRLNSLEHQRLLLYTTMEAALGK